MPSQERPLIYNAACVCFITAAGEKYLRRPNDPSLFLPLPIILPSLSPSSFFIPGVNVVVHSSSPAPPLFCSHFVLPPSPHDSAPPCLFVRRLLRVMWQPSDKLYGWHMLTPALTHYHRVLIAPRANANASSLLELWGARPAVVLIPLWPPNKRLI